MGGRNKLLVDVEGRPMVRAVVETGLAASLEPLIVVTGHEGRAVRSALAGLPVVFAENPRSEVGMSSSIACGMDALPEGASCAVVMLGDMPWVGAGDVRALVAAFDPAMGREICVPVHDRQRGNPVLWGARFFAELRALRGDVGGRALFERHGSALCEVPAGSGVLRDVDTPAALARS
jgi:molybdenum cofactor cytidylyltransferase